MKFATLPEGEEFVSMIEFKGTLFVATQRGVYRYFEPNQLKPLEFIQEKERE